MAMSELKWDITIKFLPTGKGNAMVIPTLLIKDPTNIYVNLHSYLGNTRNIFLAIFVLH